MNCFRCGDEFRAGAGMVLCPNCVAPGEKVSELRAKVDRLERRLQEFKDRIGDEVVSLILEGKYNGEILPYNAANAINSAVNQSVSNAYCRGREDGHKEAVKDALALLLLPHTNPQHISIERANEIRIQIHKRDDAVKSALGDDARCAKNALAHAESALMNAKQAIIDYYENTAR